MKKYIFIFLFLFPMISHGALVQSSATSSNAGNPAPAVSLTGMTIGNTILLSCNISSGGGPWGQDYIVGTSTQPTSVVSSDTYQVGSTYQAQWIYRFTITNATATYTCGNSTAGYRYASASEFENTLSLSASSSQSATASTTNAGTLNSVSSGNLVYMTHFQDYFLTQIPVPTNGSFVSSTDVSVAGQSRMITWYQYKSGTGNVSTEVTGWNYNDIYQASAVNYSISGGNGPSPVVNMVFPTGATTTPDFTNWILDVDYPTSSISYVGVLYGQNDSNLIYSDNVSYGSGVSANPLPILKTQPLWYLPLAYPATWFYRTFYIQNGTLYSSATSSFLISPVAPTPTLTSSTTGLTYFPASPILTATASCSAPTGTIFSAPGDNLAYAICSAGQFLFRPTDFTQSWVDSSVSGAKSVFPFRIVFDVVDTLQGELDNASTTMTAQSYDLVLHMPFSGSNFDIPLLTSTTLDSAIGSSSKAILFEVERNFIWLLFTMGLIKFIL